MKTKCLYAPPSVAQRLSYGVRQDCHGPSPWAKARVVAVTFGAGNHRPSTFSFWTIALPSTGDSLVGLIARANQLASIGVEKSRKKFWRRPDCMRPSGRARPKREPKSFNGPRRCCRTGDQASEEWTSSDEAWITEIRLVGDACVERFSLLRVRKRRA